MAIREGKAHPVAPPVTPPLEPMLARLARELPADGYLYEPKWDGFRCLAFRDGDRVDLRSRNQRPLSRYFPEIVEALLALPVGRFVLDGKGTADCVVAGFRWFVDRPLPSSLLLGPYDADGLLRHVGIASAFSEERRRELLETLRPHRVPLAGHPLERGFLLAGGATGRLRGAAGRWAPDEMEQDWTPLAPELVCEVALDQLDAAAGDPAELLPLP